MNEPLHVVTGANGLLGSHLVETLVRQGAAVRALVRAESDTTFLRSLGVAPVTVDWKTPRSLEAGVADAGVVYHCAARVSDWGPWKLFEESVIDPTRRVLDACRSQAVGRVVHVSSSRVYGHPRTADRPLDETDPIGQRLWRLWDRYPRAKIATEQLCRAYPGAWTIVRPTWTYGERDRNILARLLRTLERGQASIVGSGDNPLPLLYAGDAARGLLLAGSAPQAVGRVYNLSDENVITQRQFWDCVAQAFHLPAVTRQVPYRLAFAAGFLVELAGKALRVRRNMRVTRHSVSLMGSALRYSSVRARAELDWQPRVPIAEGLRRTFDWHLQQKAAPALVAPAAANDSPKDGSPGPA